MVRRITNFKDGKYSFRIDEIDEDIIHGMCFTEGGRKYRVDVPLGYLQKFYTGEIFAHSGPKMHFDMTIINDGSNFNFERHYHSRRGRLRAERSRVMVQILAEEFGSVERFLQFHEAPIYPGTPQENIYELLKQAQHENRL